MIKVRGSRVEIETKIFEILINNRYNCQIFLSFNRKFSCKLRETLDEKRDFRCRESYKKMIKIKKDYDDLEDILETVILYICISAINRTCKKKKIRLLLTR